MGMTIDKAVDRLEDLHFEQDNWEYEELTEDCLLNREALRLAIDTMRKYQMFQDQSLSLYMERLKADMVAMLTEIQLEFEENTVRWYVGRVDGKSDDVVLMETINDIIQQKIDKLKEQTDGTNTD